MSKKSCSLDAYKLTLKTKASDDILDPPAWRDDGLSEDVEGVLHFWDFAGSEYVKPGRRWSVVNEPVDPRTVEPLEEEAG